MGKFYKEISISMTIKTKIGIVVGVVALVIVGAVVYKQLNPARYAEGGLQPVTAAAKGLSYKNNKAFADSCTAMGGQFSAENVTDAQGHIIRVLLHCDMGSNRFDAAQVVF